MTETPLFNVLTEDVLARAIAAMPHGHAMQPGEVAADSQPLRSAVAGGSGERKQSRSQVFINQADAPSCHNCGSIMIRSGTCYKCFNCGETSGCS